MFHILCRKLRLRRREFTLLFLIGLILSALIHIFIFKKIAHLEIPSFNPASFDHIIPRKFHLERVDIDPKLIEEPQKTTSFLKPVEVNLSEKIDFSKQEKVKDLYSESKPNHFDLNELSEEKPETVNNIIPETLQKPNQSIISFDNKGTKEANLLGDLVTKQMGSIGNYSELDQLINQKAPLSSKTAPILLPTDLLFEYDADRLKPEAEKSLEKLAILIQRNPKAQFIIEGFTDSFGSNEYNLDLSTRRAESIKQWLITQQSINQQQIQSRGLGKTHFIVPSTGNIQEQRLNRRVEIVIRQ